MEPIPSLGAWILVAVRVFAILRAQVLWQATVGAWWTVVAAGLALVLAPGLADAAGPVELSLTAVAIEALVGTAIGVVVSLPGWALIGGSATSAAVLRTTPGPMVGLAVALVAATSLALDLHQPLLVSLSASVETIPPGTFAIAYDASSLAQAVHASVVLALSLATPVLLAALVAEVAMAGVGAGPAPAGPQAAAPWLRTAAALVALGASWQAYAIVWAHAVTGT
jgi:flagellar biosynthesis protein FliR